MRSQLVVLPVALVLMLLALVAGVFRLMGTYEILDQPPLRDVFAFHGQIMVFGFLAVLITTERYLGSLSFKLSPAVHAMPFLVGAGGLLKVVGLLAGVDPLNTTGSILLVVGLAIYLYLLLAVSWQSAQPLPFRFMEFGALFLLLGVIFSLQASPVANMGFTLFLLAFPILTILGERVELSRFLAPGVFRRAELGLWAAVAAFVLLIIQDWPWLTGVWAILMALAAAPLLTSELTLVRAGERSPQRLHGYLGRHLVVAYFWLFLGLVLALVWAFGSQSGALRDASTHSLAVGFIGTMILAHAPVVAPALLPRILAQDRLSLLPGSLLWAGALLRVGGDVLLEAGLPVQRVIALSGIFILAALVAFIWMMVRALKPAGGT